MVEDLTSFPRGKIHVPANDEEKKIKKKRVVSDILFGEKRQSAGKTKKKRQRKNSVDETTTKTKSLLPIGGGAVVVPNKGDPYIEPLSFSKFAKGFALLACVKEVHEDLVIFSLPNQWTGYMLRNEKDEFTLEQCLEYGQVLSVRIVKAAQEQVPGGKKTTRRIQVTCEPSKVNATDTSITTGGLLVRGRVLSIEDHGILVDLGLQRRGFLPYQEISGEYSVEGPPSLGQWNLLEGRFMDFIVRSGAKNTKITPLELPSRVDMARHLLPTSSSPTLHGLTPGALVRATVEAVVRNGLCVTFGGGVFRGAIEMGHLGTYWIPSIRSEAEDWKPIFEKNRSVVARIIAVDAATKIVRLSLLPHLLNQRLPAELPSVGTVVQDAVVIRQDPGIGALLALPTTTTTSMMQTDEEDLPKDLHKPICNDEKYLEASKVQAVYVHISKAMDPNAGKVDEADFAKAFAPSTKHSVRILSTANMIEGIASGGSAESIISAHVLTHSDLIPGKIYRQVPICAQLDSGGILVDFGMGIRGMIPDIHLFDQASSSEYRRKTKKLKFTVGSKIDVRVLTVDSTTKRCMVTAKKALLKTDDVVTSFAGLRVGQRATGYVSKLDERGMTVTFFNRVYAFATARSIMRQLGVESLEAYQVGDVVAGRISNVKNFRKEGSPKTFWEISFSPGGEWEGPNPEADEAMEGVVPLRVGTILPSKSLRVVELVNGRQKEKGFVPGYAIVTAKTKYLFDESECSTLMPEFECKLPFDQLFDDYSEVSAETAAELDEQVGQAFTVGRKIASKAVVLKAPLKSRMEYFNATGNLPVMSLRQSFIECIEERKAANDQSEREFVPSPESDIYVGALLRGYVAQVDSRHGAFVQFLDSLSGMVPKKKGGLSLPKFGSISCRVVAIDKDSNPMKLLLEPGGTKTGSKRKKKDQMVTKAASPAVPFHVGDVIEEAEVKAINFKFAVLLASASGEDSNGFEVRLNCTMALPPHFEPLKDRSKSQPIHEGHPFYKWEVGKKLSKLHVVSIEGNRVDVSIYSNSDVPETGVGEKVLGVVTGVADTNKGLWVMISPSVTGFLDALEVATDPQVLNALASNFPIGTFLECTIIKSQSQSAAADRRPSLSLLSRSGDPWIPQDASVSVARVKSARAIPRLPALRLDLREGLIGRCCITELTDPTEWSDFPLGKSSLKRETQPASLSQWKPGSYHAVTILEKFPGRMQNVFDVSLQTTNVRNPVKVAAPKVGEIVKGYVTETNSRGCFVRLSRTVEGRSILRLMNDGFLPDPVSSFPPGRLVAAKVKAIKPASSDPQVKFMVDLDMRESSILGDGTSLQYDDVKIGSKYKGSISRVEEYGVFVKLADSNVSGLCHKSECSDSYVKAVSALFEIGDLVKVLVLKKDDKKRTVGFSMRASHFEDDEESEDDDESSTAMSEESGAMLDSEDDNNQEGLGKPSLLEKTDRQSSSSSDDSSSDTDSEESTGEDITGQVEPAMMDTNIGIDWGDSTKQENDEQSDSESASSEDCSDEEQTGSSHRSRKKQAQRRREERDIARRESALADGTADENPETAADFERLLVGQPNSSELWIRYMAFHLALADVATARHIADRALRKIEFLQESEKLNVWLALLALELKYGTDESLEGATVRASQHNNPKHVYLRLCEMVRKETVSDSSPATVERADKFFAKMSKKFKNKKTAWLAHAEYLLASQREDEAQELLKRALLSLPSYKHVETMSRFAQMMFEFSSPEKARTLFDGILAKNPKRLDLLFVYADKEIKYGHPKAARSLFEMATSTMKLSDKKMKSLFKKWYRFEEDHGTDETRESVKDAARKYVES